MGNEHFTTNYNLGKIIRLEFRTNYNSLLLQLFCIYGSKLVSISTKTNLHLHQESKLYFSTKLVLRISNQQGKEDPSILNRFNNIIILNIFPSLSILVFICGHGSRLSRINFSINGWFFLASIQGDKDKGVSLTRHLTFTTLRLPDSHTPTADLS